MTESSTPASPDEDAVEEAEAAVSTLDSEFGRTTDPVRMYMREMGSVELLTREGEIEIAKRIEDGLRHMIQAISACPTTIAEILELAEKVAARRDAHRRGGRRPDRSERRGDHRRGDRRRGRSRKSSTPRGEDEDGAAVQSASLLQLKAAALERFGAIGQLYAKMMKALAKHGSRSKPYLKAQEDISRELMMIRFSAKQIEALCDSVRRHGRRSALVTSARSWSCAWKRRACRARTSSRSSPATRRTSSGCAARSQARKPYSEALSRFAPAILEQQQRLIDLQKRVGIPAQGV